VVGESEGSTALKPKPVIENDHEPVPSILYLHNIPVSLRYILMLSAHLLISLPSECFPRGFPTKILHAFLMLQTAVKK
jgi:hypothetical protein